MDQEPREVQETLSSLARGAYIVLDGGEWKLRNETTVYRVIEGDHVSTLTQKGYISADGQSRYRITTRGATVGTPSGEHATTGNRLPPYQAVTSDISLRRLFVWPPRAPHFLWQTCLVAYLMVTGLFVFNRGWWTGAFVATLLGTLAVLSLAVPGLGIARFRQGFLLFGAELMWAWLGIMGVCLAGFVMGDGWGFLAAFGFVVVTVLTLAPGSAQRIGALTVALVERTFRLTRR